MLALLALGVLQKTRTFAATDVHAEALPVLGMEINGDVADFYDELIPILRERQRADLLPAIRKIVKSGRRAQKIEAWKAHARDDVDMKYLGAGLMRLKRMMQTGKSIPMQGM
jgi:hypothetical protein